MNSIYLMEERTGSEEGKGWGAINLLCQVYYTHEQGNLNNNELSITTKAVVSSSDSTTELGSYNLNRTYILKSSPNFSYITYKSLYSRCSKCIANVPGLAKDRFLLSTISINK
jgi:hypothetical protein